jgi:sugar lactone lactonase YvrE
MRSGQHSETQVADEGLRIDARAELVLDAHAELGEGPVWDDRRHVLWWVDIKAGRVHRFDPINGLDRAYEIGTPVGCVALCDDGRLAVAVVDALLTLDSETEAIETLVPFEPGAVAVRCNDGKCDPLGRLWIDRMAFDRGIGTGSLVRFDGICVDTIRRGLTIPNGLDWTGDGCRMYFVDSRDPAVSVLDFDVESGTIGEGRPFMRMADVPEWPRPGVPDGLTVDEEDCVWVAVWGGGCVLRFHPDGTLIGRIDVPVSRVSSCAFGGEDLRDLFITTAWEDATAEQLVAQPNAGGLYRARPGVRGRPARRMKTVSHN